MHDHSKQRVHYPKPTGRLYRSFQQRRIVHRKEIISFYKGNAPLANLNIQRLLKSIEGFKWVDVDALISMLPHYPVQTAAMRLGWLLERFQKQWCVSEDVLKSLEQYRTISRLFLVPRRFTFWMIPDDSSCTSRDLTRYRIRAEFIGKDAPSWVDP